MNPNAVLDDDQKMVRFWKVHRKKIELEQQQSQSSSAQEDSKRAAADQPKKAASARKRAKAAKDGGPASKREDGNDESFWNAFDQGCFGDCSSDSFSSAMTSSEQYQPQQQYLPPQSQYFNYIKREAVEEAMAMPTVSYFGPATTAGDLGSQARPFMEGTGYPNEVPTYPQYR
jgi:hypothetical protein